MALATIWLGEMRIVSSPKYSGLHGQVVTIMKATAQYRLGEWDYNHKEFELVTLMLKKSA